MKMLQSLRFNTRYTPSLSLLRASVVTCRKHSIKAQNSAQNTNSKDKISWISHVSYDESTGKLREIYDRVKGPDNNVDNIMLTHGLRINSLEGHMAIYKKVLHSNNNQLAKWVLEMIGVYVSYLNNCHYCFDHHFKGMETLLKLKYGKENGIKIATIVKNYIKKGGLSELEKLNDLECNVMAVENIVAMFKYANKLTVDPTKMEENDIISLKNDINWFDDGHVLELNQVVSYFNYANRTVVGLGINTKGDIIGLSPSDNNDENNWNHASAQDSSYVAQ